MLFLSISSKNSNSNIEMFYFTSIRKTTGADLLIGLDDKSSEGSFVWSNGKTMVYNNFGSGNLILKIFSDIRENVKTVKPVYSYLSN